jgi:hypothetical protein
MLSTMKSILTVKASKAVAALINAISYGFNALVIKQLTELEMNTTVTIVIITNLIGVYLSIYIMDKIKKDCLWKISVTTRDKTLIEKIEPFSISYTVGQVQYKGRACYNIDIFSKSKKNSSIIREILKEYRVKYNITEIDKRL